MFEGFDYLIAAAKRGDIPSGVSIALVLGRPSQDTLKAVAEATATLLSADEMSSRQFGIYATPSDLTAITRLASGLAVPFVVLERYKRNQRTVIVADLAAASGLACALTTQEHVRQIHWRVLQTGEEMLDLTTSPVIDVLRPYFDGREMSRGRFYYTTAYYDEDQRLIRKPTSFLEWASDVFRVVKKGLTYDKNLTPFASVYVAPGARSWIETIGRYSVNPAGRIIASAASQQ